MKTNFANSVLELAKKRGVISNNDAFVIQCLKSTKYSKKLPVKLNLVTAHLLHCLLEIKSEGPEA